MQTHPIFIVVHIRSARYVAICVEYIRFIIADLTRSNVELRFVERVEDIELRKDSTVFVIGEGFPAFPKRDGRYYIYLNFSLLYNVSSWWTLSWRARRWIARKRRMFAEKAESFDMILDFYEPQSALMKEEFKGRGVQVLPFLTNVLEVKRDCILPVAEREWDICVVSTLTPRRRKLYTKLENLGYKLSPLKTAELVSVMSRCKLTLNVHMQRCSTLEAPRIVHALNAGSCLVTERCYGLEDIIPDRCYHAADYGGLIRVIRRLLENHEEITRTARLGYEYMRGEYEEKCRASWKRIVDSIPGLALE
jgi:hypothetical protein